MADLPGTIPSAVPALPHLAISGSSPAPRVEAMEGLGETRGLFWQNVVREMLLTFPMLVTHHPEAADGRVGVLTRSGERIPLASAEPLFPCSISDPEGMALCLAVQATVFNLHTPGGEVFTLPVSEIRGVHTMTDELLKQMEKEAKKSVSERDQSVEPFGFAAFTSLSKRHKHDPSHNQPGI